MEPMLPPICKHEAIACAAKYTTSRIARLEAATTGSVGKASTARNVHDESTVRKSRSRSDDTSHR